MLKSLLHTAIRAFERRYDYDAGYLHEVAENDPFGLWKFIGITRAGERSGGLPLDAVFAARLAAAMHEDCGPCAQIVIDMAIEAGVEPGTLAALAAGNPDAAPEDCALAFRFARAVLTADTDVDALRDAVTARFGRRGPWYLSLALSTARLYPVMKRATGHARACTRLKVGGETITPAGIESRPAVSA